MSSILSSPNPPPPTLHREIHHKEPLSHIFTSATASSLAAPFHRSSGSSNKYWKGTARRDVRAFAFWPELFKLDSLEMEPIQDCEQFDRILERAKELSQPVLVDWMAAWCRKCIYLKPKLEKLAAEYDTKIKFCCVDVNNVPQALVKRGNISKMPTIQIWKDGEMKAEVIGGHKAWLVVEEVRQMIQLFV